MPVSPTKRIPFSLRSRRTLGLLIGEDPWVIPHDGGFLLTQSAGNDGAIGLAYYEDPFLKRRRRHQVIWSADPKTDHAKLVWAPEIHAFGDRWYVYFTACDGESLNHRMYVLESDSADPFGSYREVGKIAESSDTYAIDQTVLEHQGQLFALWCGREANVARSAQNLYIAPMANPWTISGDRVCISRPELEWERSAAWPINEGPQVLKHNDKTFVVYSADASWTSAYKLGLLELVGSNATDAGSWKKHPKPVFWPKSGTTVGAGHASFFETADGNYFAYHRKMSRLPGWDRRIEVKRFGWTPDGLPLFPN